MGAIPLLVAPAFLALLQQRPPGGDSIATGRSGIHDRGGLTPLDSVSLADPPIPDPVARVFQFLFNDVPQWVQIGGVVLGVLVAMTLLVIAWRKRAVIRRWLVTRSRGAKIALATAVGLVLVTVAGAGAATWHYIQHDNDFCSGCHVMAPAFGRFQTSEHRKLECHDCHRQSIFASAMELYSWVLHRPERIPPHAEVPTRICAECHIQEQPDSVWQRISATAGHRIHLESDSAALKDVQCVTCHAAAVHEFAAADSTCGQSSCHESTPIRLAGMRNQTALHCATCHQFTRPVSEQLALDTARAVIVPSQQQCLSCHEMRERLRDFDPRAEPHRALCGTCHNPHEQETPEAAFSSCATAGCHARADTITVFHRGISASALADCGSCHKAHTWHAEGASCVSCHRDVFDEPGPLPRRTAVTHGTRSYGHQVALQSQQRAPAGTRAPDLGYSGPRPFSHRLHRDLQCTSCHSSGGERHGELEVRTAAQCQQCHHTPARANTPCARCHEPREIAGAQGVATTLRVTTTVSRQRELPFRHEQHTRVECGSCHAMSLAMTPTATCTSCHAQHHQPRADCRLCHAPAKTVHTRQAHIGCVGCHDATKTAALQATRPVCLTCHVDLVNHNPGRECAQCHQVSWRPNAPAARGQ